MKRSWFLLLLLLSTLPAVAGEMYSWTDANGVKHFSDSPPPSSVKAQKVKVKGGLTTNEPAAEPAKAEADKNNGPALAAAAGYSPDDIKRNCETATRNFDFVSSQKIPLDANGQPDLDAAKARQAQIDKAEQQKKLFCKG